MALVVVVVVIDRRRRRDLNKEPWLLGQVEHNGDGFIRANAGSILLLSQHGQHGWAEVSMVIRLSMLTVA